MSELNKIETIELNLSLNEIINIISNEITHPLIIHYSKLNFNSTLDKINKYIISREKKIKNDIFTDIKKVQNIISREKYSQNTKISLEDHLNQVHKELDWDNIDLGIFSLTKEEKIQSDILTLNDFIQYEKDNDSKKNLEQITKLIRDKNLVKTTDLRSFINCFSSFDSIAKNIDYLLLGTSEVSQETLLAQSLNYFGNLKLSTLSIDDYKKYQMGLKPIYVNYDIENPISYYFSGIEIEELILPILKGFGINNESILKRLSIEWVKKTKTMPLINKFKDSKINERNIGIPFNNFLAAVRTYKTELNKLN